VDKVALAHVCCECLGFAFSVALAPSPNDTLNGSQQPIVAAMFQTARAQLAVRDQPLYTANDLKALYEFRYLTRMKSLVVQKVGVTQAGSFV
jgi:hypothetical protein